jgi:hypothetical protein
MGPGDHRRRRGRRRPESIPIGSCVEMGRFRIGIGIGIDCNEGPSASFPYPGGIQADSPGSRSAPRVHVRKGNNPGGVEAPAAFAPRWGADSITTHPSPGTCFARPGAIGSHPSGMSSCRRRGSGSGIDGTRRSPRATRTSPPRIHSHWELCRDGAVQDRDRDRVGTTDFADSTDKQGLGFALPPTCEVRARPRWKHPLQSRPSVESVKSAVMTTAVFRLKHPQPSHRAGVRIPSQRALPRVRASYDPGLSAPIPPGCPDAGGVGAGPAAMGPGDHPRR